MDKFIEILLGKLHGDRINLLSVHSIPLIDFPVNGDDQMKSKINDFKSYLVHLEPHLAKLNMTNTDLLNIRDEILASLNQFLYLLSLH